MMNVLTIKNWIVQESPGNEPSIVNADNIGAIDPTVIMGRLGTEIPSKTGSKITIAGTNKTVTIAITPTELLNALCPEAKLKTPVPVPDPPPSDAEIRAAQIAKKRADETSRQATAVLKRAK